MSKKRWMKLAQDLREQAIKIETITSVLSDEACELAWETYEADKKQPNLTTKSKGGDA